MHEQRELFQGISTYNITTVVNCSVLSVLLEESESCTIINRPDINAILRKLHSKNFLNVESVNVRQ